jgi:hypothetical protein
MKRKLGPMFFTQKITPRSMKRRFLLSGTQMLNIFTSDHGKLDFLSNTTYRLSKAAFYRCLPNQRSKVKD